MALSSVAADDAEPLFHLDTLRVVVISVWIFVDVLLLVRRLSLIAVAVRQILLSSSSPRCDVMMTSSRAGGYVTWATADQSRQPLAAASPRQNGGGPPFCVAARPTTGDDLGGSPEPEVVRAVTSSSRRRHRKWFDP